MSRLINNVVLFTIILCVLSVFIGLWFYGQCPPSVVITAVIVLMVAIVVFIIIPTINYKNQSHAPQVIPQSDQTIPTEPSGIIEPSISTMPIYETVQSISRWMGWKDTVNPLNTNTNEYQLYPGRYAAITIRPGFHEHLTGSNINRINKLSPKMGVENNSTQHGGANQKENKSHNPPEQKQDKSQHQPLTPTSTSTPTPPSSPTSIRGVTNTPSTASNPISNIRTKATSPHTIAKQLTERAKHISQQNDEIQYNKVLPVVDDMVARLPSDMRLTNVIYPNDIVEIMSGEKILQRADNNSMVIMGDPIPNWHTNLSKIHFESISGGPIRYNDLLNIKHSALIDHTVKIKSIKYGERVQSHQEGPMYGLFRLISADSVNSQDYVKYGDNVLIACGDQSGDKVYLKIEGDQSLSSESTKEDATVFNILLKQPYSKDILCVCPDETIFP